MSNKNNPIIQECHFFTGRFFCHTGQYSVVQWQEMEKKPLFNNALNFKHVTLLKGMLYVNNTAYIMQKY